MCTHGTGLAAFSGHTPTNRKAPPTMDSNPLLRESLIDSLGICVARTAVPNLGGMQQTRALKHLGSGSYAQVYKLENGHGKGSALKVFDSGSQFDGSCIVEFAISAYLRDSDVQNVLFHTRVVTTGGNLAVMMPLGEPVHTVVRKGMPVQEVMSYAWCLLRGIKGMHRAGVVHRDIKPANTLRLIGEDVRTADRYRLADLGSAAFLNSHGVWAGDASRTTPNFRDPETCRGTPSMRLNPLVDVWAVALSIFYALSGGTYLIATNSRSLKVVGSADVIAGVKRAIGEPRPFPPRRRGETAAAFGERRHRAHATERDAIFKRLVSNHAIVRDLVSSSVSKTSKLASGILRVVCSMLVRSYSLRFTAKSAFNALCKLHAPQLPRAVSSTHRPGGLAASRRINGPPPSRVLHTAAGAKRVQREKSLDAERGVKQRTKRKRKRGRTRTPMLGFL